jgi:hypothetical protein
MTAQSGDTLYYRNEAYWLACEPLADYLETRKDIVFSSWESDCNRGYYGTWEIKDDKLFIIKLSGKNASGDEIYLDYIFPNQKEVFAEWFTGEIRIPIGNPLKHIHMSYWSEYEKDLFLNVESGNLVGEREVDNRFDKSLSPAEIELLIAENDELLNKLKLEREKIAQFENCNPDDICVDELLMVMVKIKPLNRQDYLRVIKLSDKKAYEYAENFIRVIQHHKH